MRRWHTCKTTHCRAGWVVTLAGEAGKILENFFSTPHAAYLIYQKSSPHKVDFARFYDSNEDAMSDMKRMAKLESENIMKKCVDCKWFDYEKRFSSASGTKTLLAFCTLYWTTMSEARNNEKLCGSKGKYWTPLTEPSENWDENGVGIFIGLGVGLLFALCFGIISFYIVKYFLIGS